MPYPVYSYHLWARIHAAPPGRLYVAAFVVVATFCVRDFWKFRNYPTEVARPIRLRAGGILLLGSLLLIGTVIPYPAFSKGGWIALIVLVAGAAIYLFDKGSREQIGPKSPRLDGSLPHGGRAGWYVTLATGVILLAVVALLPKGSDLRARIALAGIGVICAVLGLARPQTFWEAPRVQSWRSVLGDRVVVALYLTTGLLIIGVAFLTRF
jgi:hypothetical protein